MYSLYRAWFGGEESYPRLETLSPPDTVVRVGNEGEHHFVAHRGVLAAHSGYLKALLATASVPGVNSDGSDAPGSKITSVSVSSIGGEAFAPLLNYMYTGRLDVTLDNVYSVLLATHLLHMPGALEQCRVALMRLRAPPVIPTPSTSQTGSVLRPVPSRLVGPPLCWPQTGLYASGPIGLPHLPPLQLTPTISVLPTSILPETQVSTAAYSTRETSISPCSSTSPIRSKRRSSSRSRSPKVIASRSVTGRKDEDSRPSSRQHRQGPSTSPSGSSEHISVTDLEQPTTSSRSRTSRSSHERPGSSSSGVVYDVACCDGPVRFHRVLNENYSAPAVPGHAPRLVPRPCVEDDDTSVENDENGRPDVVGDPNVVLDSKNGSYTCTYCRLTFKSQYCYRKHARRHLLPTENDSNSQDGAKVEAKKRDVRLLDLNVQYYPCKICGSKFPSYYFVHKHRKICHSNVEDPERNEESSTVQSTSERSQC